MAVSTGDPIRNARVILLPESPQTPMALMDAAGAFGLTVHGTSVGRYRIEVSKTGHGRNASPTILGDIVFTVSHRVTPADGSHATGLCIEGDSRERR